MTNTKQREFEKEFGQFAIMGSAGRVYNGAFRNNLRISEVWEWIEKRDSQSCKGVVEEIIDDLTEKQRETGWCRAFNERLLKKYQDKIISLTKPKI